MVNSNVVNLTTDKFKNILNSNVPVLVDFWAGWCGPCKALGPIIEELANEYINGQVKICKVNVDEEPTLAERYRIMSIPMILIFKNGEIVDQFIGLRTKDEIKDIIDKHI